jgi:hypothetical protein
VCETMRVVFVNLVVVVRIGDTNAVVVYITQM